MNDPERRFDVAGRNRRKVSRRRLLEAGLALCTVGVGGLGFALWPDGRASASGPMTVNKPVVRQPDTEVENVAAEKKTPVPEEPTKQKLGEYRTDYRYSDSRARKYNLRISSRAIDGTVLEPGEAFSMNDHLIGLDYKSAKVFAEGGETSADGGGLCQVTSTLYMAAQYAGLEMLERYPHYTVLPYIRPGFDATVWFGGQGIPELDMRFKNNTASDITLREYVNSEGFLIAEIWGQPTGREVTMRSVRDFRDLERGIKYSTYKTLEKDGRVVRQGLLYEDIYSFPPPTKGGSYNPVRVSGW